jgi:Transposase IS4
MNTKAAGEGFKIYSCTSPCRYIVDFRFSSATEEITELDETWQKDKWSASEALILELTTAVKKRFPRATPFIFHLDNPLTRRRLYQELYERGIGANGTAKKGSGIPKKLVYLKQLLKKEKDYGKCYNIVIGDVNCIAVCDMATTLFMTTVFDVTNKVQDFFFR